MSSVESKRELMSMFKKRAIQVSFDNKLIGVSLRLVGLERLEEAKAGGGAKERLVPGKELRDSEKTTKLLYSQSCIFNDSTQRSFGQFLVIGDG